ncbi:hypothetical protein COUCH_17835 [Couchioplanes caeruleus]|uniref:DUF2231 domain-containing protein n=1 Tax=Couchioplanes caeruleus TaxID=56438 RepID=UPI0020BF5AAF|nr:DUF2231 domain-containing protein [Couchioplanes caeruleus]UQU68025.1 hypothetical protein COUCH_17835 [Couchioplanes caeruleus]
MGTVNGLPAHILLVHAVVVLLPLAALLLVLTAAWPEARRRFAGPNAILSVLVVILVPLTTSAGEWLEERVPRTELLHDHAELGDTALFAAIPVALLALVVWWRHREATATGSLGGERAGGAGVATATGRRTYLAPLSVTITRIVTVLAVLIAGFAVFDTYRIGDSGAKAAWNDKVSSTPAHGGPDGD